MAPKRSAGGLPGPSPGSARGQRGAQGQRGAAGRGLTCDGRIVQVGAGGSLGAAGMLQDEEEEEKEEAAQRSHGPARPQLHFRVPAAVSCSSASAPAEGPRGVPVIPAIPIIPAKPAPPRAAAAHRLPEPSAPPPRSGVSQDSLPPPQWSLPGQPRSPRPQWSLPGVTPASSRLSAGITILPAPPPTSPQPAPSLRRLLAAVRPGKPRSVCAGIAPLPPAAAAVVWPTPARAALRTGPWRRRARADRGRGQPSPGHTHGGRANGSGTCPRPRARPRAH